MRRGGMGAHHSASPGTVVWLTPPEIIEALGPFDLDPCAPEPRPWDMAKRHYTETDNGLVQEWEGRVWCNPPYVGGLIEKFMEKMAQHNYGTALVFSRMETSWFFRHVWERATALMQFEGRLNFHFPDGKRAPANAVAPSVLVAYGFEDADRLAESGLGGVFIPLTGSGQVVVAFRPTPDITWSQLVEEIAARQGGRLELATAYILLSKHPKVQGKQHWKAKIRQIVQRPVFRRVAPSTYALVGAA